MASFWEKMPGLSPGRNNFLENIWRAVSPIGNIFVPGLQRRMYSTPPIMFSGKEEESPAERNWDFEPPKRYPREPVNGPIIDEIYAYSIEVATAMGILSTDWNSSADGDDQGWVVESDDKEVSKVLERLTKDVIGGNTLTPIVRDMLLYGDAFAGIAIDEKQNRIKSILQLPSFEIFRVESSKGQLLRFEQRLYSIEDWLRMHPLLVAHWRFNKQLLYGRSLIWNAIPHWAAYQDALTDLKQVSRAIGINPTLHILPEEYGITYLEEYRKRHEQETRVRAITDYYMTCGGDIRKLANFNPSLEASIQNVQAWRNLIGTLTRVPPWQLGLPTTGAREIAGAPNLFYERWINDIRGHVVDGGKTLPLGGGLRHICNLELALNDIPPERWVYQIKFPQISVSIYDSGDTSTTTEGIENIDTEEPSTTQPSQVQP